MNRRGSRLVAAAVATAGALIITAALALGAASAAGVAGCAPSGRVLARHHGVVLWSVVGSQSESIYECVGGQRPRLVLSEPVTFAMKAHSLERAGHFIAFIFSDDPFISKLFVFDTQRGRKEFSEQALCTHGSGCPLVSIGRYMLAPNGWVAEVLNGLESGLNKAAGPVDELVATKNGRDHYELDVGLKLSPLSLHGGTLSWTSDLGGASSVRLGPAVVPSASSQSLTACQLLGAADLTPVLGTFKATATGGQCTYTSTSTSHPGLILTLMLQTGLSAAQVTAAEQAAQKNSDITLETTPKFQISETSTLGNMNDEQLQGFVPGASLTFDMASPGPNADEQLAHLAAVALDRLCSLPVKRAQ